MQWALLKWVEVVIVEHCVLDGPELLFEKDFWWNRDVSAIKHERQKE